MAVIYSFNGYGYFKAIPGNSKAFLQQSSIWGLKEDYLLILFGILVRSPSNSFKKAFCKPDLSKSSDISIDLTHI